MTVTTFDADARSPLEREQPLVDRDGRASLVEGFYPAEVAQALFETLLAELAWESEEIVFFGKRVLVPRLICWYGDAAAVYRYSGVEHEPKPWTPTLQKIREDVSQTCGVAFNSVLGNLYRDGNDSMGWHADNEPELGPKPVVASLSFGATRLFKLRHNRSRETVDATLQNGSLLIMSGTLQSHWRHAVPKTKMTVEPRINLTFRRISRRS